MGKAAFSCRGIDAELATLTVVTAVIDQCGGFTIVCPDPPGSFRLYCHATNGAGVLTNWLMLQDPAGD
jgi:hypothetical protein